MGPLTASIVIDAPRERIFDYLADLANHVQFTDHYLVDWRLTREVSVGRGAGARFRVKAPGDRFGFGDVTIAELQAPYKIVEVGRTGKANRVRTLGVFELQPASPGATRVSFTLQTDPDTISDRMKEALGGRMWVKRQNAKAMRRLRAIVEGSARARSQRVSVAGR